MQVKPSNTILFGAFFFIMPVWFYKSPSKFIFIQPVQNTTGSFACNHNDCSNKETAKKGHHSEIMSFMRPPMMWLPMKVYVCN